MKEFYNCDCMEKLRDYPDNYFDLAIVDPPYSLGVQSMSYTKTGNKRASKNSRANSRDYKHAEWDIKPDREYFDLLLRISKNQIVWGGNYFADMLPPSKGFIVWDKRCADNIKNDFADCELAWISDGLGVARVFRFLWSGMLQGDMKNKEDKFHPTQKPTALYRWLLTNYAKPGDLILDTHVGSASSLIACEDMGFDYVGFEIDKEYYNKAKQRLNDFNNQIRMDWRLP